MQGFVKTVIRQFTSACSYPQICFVGSGPAAFYTAQNCLKNHSHAQVDIYERLPVPFGLVRYGIAPDHPEVAFCIKKFSKVAQNKRLSFFGNVTVGTDVSLDQLKQAYHAVVLAYGTSSDKLLNIPGEDLGNVFGVSRFVGWYNGFPGDTDLDVDLDVEDVVVVGHGNVAIDVARILLTNIDVLRKTEIPEPVLAKLSKSRVKRVTMVGRRRVEDVSFTLKELREMCRLEGCTPLFRKRDVQELPQVMKKCDRPKHRLMELIHKTTMNGPDSEFENTSTTKGKEWRLRFLRSPLEILANDEGTAVKGVKFGINRMDDEKVSLTDATETLDCGLVVRSIGYVSAPICDSIPFDSRKGIVPNDEENRVIGQKGMYVSGWIGSGPSGVILNTNEHGRLTSKSIISDLKDGVIGENEKRGKMDLIKVLARKKIRPVTFNDWTNIDSYEIEEGKKLGKPRERVTSFARMIEIAHNL